MSAENNSDTNIEKTSITGIVIGIGTLIACELPILLVALGFGSLATAASALKPPPWAEALAIVLVVAAFLVLLYTFSKRLWQRRRTNPE